MRYAAALFVLVPVVSGQGFLLFEDTNEIRIKGPALEATIRKQGYVSGVAAGSLVDRKSGFRDPGFGLAIVDFLIEPGSDEDYRAKLPPRMLYTFHNSVHGAIPKRLVEGPQICTEAKKLSPKIIRGNGFVAIRQSFRYSLAAPGKKAGSEWEQTLVFPEGKRYFLAADVVRSVNDGAATALRIDMPGHIKHKQGDTFSAVYLSYDSPIPASEFVRDFPPDAKYRYVRKDMPPARFIRAVRLKDPKSGQDGPWLAGMTLDPASVSEAWCHQRGYVSMIQEIGGRPVRAGESFGAAYVVGYFSSIEEMEQVYDQLAKGRPDRLIADAQGWRLTRAGASPK